MDIRQLVLVLDSPVTPDVAYPRAPLGYHAPHEQPAMAARWILFSAHERHPSLAGKVFEFLQPAQEGSAPRHLPIEDVAVPVVERRIPRTAPQTVTQEYVPDASRLDTWAENVPVELRGMVRGGVGPHVRHHLDAMFLKQGHETIQGMVGMTYREHGATH